MESQPFMYLGASPQAFGRHGAVHRLRVDILSSTYAKTPGAK